ncbi:MAG TPA: hypothetical protein DEP84_19815 [Chloroflexi bacterium]|nr:hypothetical protein [Chloroflexota bacterium]
MKEPVREGLVSTFKTSWTGPLGEGTGLRRRWLAGWPGPSGRTEHLGEGHQILFAREGVVRQTEAVRDTRGRIEDREGSALERIGAGDPHALLGAATGTTQSRFTTRTITAGSTARSKWTRQTVRGSWSSR